VRHTLHALGRRLIAYAKVGQHVRIGVAGRVRRSSVIAQVEHMHLHVRVRVRSDVISALRAIIYTHSMQAGQAYCERERQLRIAQPTRNQPPVVARTQQCVQAVRACAHARQRRESLGEGGGRATSRRTRRGAVQARPPPCRSRAAGSAVAQTVPHQPAGALPRLPCHTFVRAK
jgi:hypothetical protein